MNKTNKKAPSRTTKSHASKGVIRGYPPFNLRPVHVRKATDARRLLSRYILAFQSGAVRNQDAKDMAYLLISYIQITKQTEFDDRLNKIEELINKGEQTNEGSIENIREAIKVSGTGSNHM